MTSDLSNPIIYCVGPNGTGKTRYLRRTAETEQALFVPKLRQEGGLPTEFNDSQEFTRFRQNFESTPEQVALRLLRESASLRLKVFSILSRKLGRDLSLNVVERSTAFAIKSGFQRLWTRRVAIPIYNLDQESAGVRELLILLTLLYSPFYSKLCIDEPELSLHPEAQRFLKNEMLNVVEQEGKQIWVATHSPVFFAPESLEELERALFFSSPDQPPEPPNFGGLQEGERLRMSRMFLRLDSEKWLLAHAKMAVFCEGIYDKAIIRRVLDRTGVDLARRDIALIETGGHTEFFPLSLLCSAINRTAYYVADLDVLVSSSLIDHLDRDRTSDPAREKLSGVSDSVQEYVSRHVRQFLGTLTDQLINVSIDTSKCKGLEPYTQELTLAPDKEVGDREKKLVLEMVVKYGDELESATSVEIQKNVRLVRGGVEKARQVLRDCGIFLQARGTIEACYAGWFLPTVELSDSKKRDSFEAEYSLLELEDVEAIKIRYSDLLDFFDPIGKDDFDFCAFVRAEVERSLARIQTILLEDEPSDLDALIANPRFGNLKLSDLLHPETLLGESGFWILEGRSADNFTPQFRFRLNTREGIQSEGAVIFEETEGV